MSLTLFVNVDLLFCRISFSMGFLMVTLELCIIAKDAEGHFPPFSLWALSKHGQLLRGPLSPEKAEQVPCSQKGQGWHWSQSGGWRAHIEWGGVLMGSQGRTTGPCSSLTPGFNLTVFSDHPDPEVPFSVTLWCLHCSALKSLVLCLTYMPTPHQARHVESNRDLSYGSCPFPSFSKVFSRVISLRDKKTWIPKIISFFSLNQLKLSRGQQDTLDMNGKSGSRSVRSYVYFQFCATTCCSEQHSCVWCFWLTTNPKIKSSLLRLVISCVVALWLRSSIQRKGLRNCWSFVRKVSIVLGGTEQ